MIRQSRVGVILLLAITFIYIYFLSYHIDSPEGNLEEINQIIHMLRIEGGLEYSHPLENSCRYPILEPEDPSLKPYIKHGRKIDCNQTQANLVTWDSERGVLKVDQNLARKTFYQNVMCYYRALTFVLEPNVTEILNLTEWKQFDVEAKINYDVVQVECNTSSGRRVYRFAFSQVAKSGDAGTKFEPSSLKKLSLNILVIDSTSLNQFRRHAPLSYDYMVKKMGFFVFDGYTKVGDHSYANLIPLLSGLRFQNEVPDMPGDVDDPVDSEAVPFLWHLFRAKNFVTMFNDDTAKVRDNGISVDLFHASRNLGLKSQPAHHFYRAWYLYHRVGLRNYCFGHEPHHEQQLDLIRQMIKKYNDTCHFSFTYMSELAHDDPNMLELLDEVLLEKLLMESYEGGHLKNTAFVIMGDHGQRFHPIQFSYIGRIEERMSFFALYLPEEFRRENPEMVRNLKINQNRLVSHFDAHEMFRDILNGDFSGKASTENGMSKLRPKRGISLFRPISINRTCTQASIPVNFCVCMVKDRVFGDNWNDNVLRSIIKDLLSRWITEKFSHQVAACPRKKLGMVLNKISALTTNLYVRKGIRNVTLMSTVNIANGHNATIWFPEDIEYLETEFVVMCLGIRGIAQMQHNKILEILTLTVDPLVQVIEKVDMNEVQS